MHEHSHSNQRSKTHILARSPPTPLPPPLWPGPLVRFVLCTHIDSLWTGFSIPGPSSIFLGVNLVEHQGDSRRRGPHGRSSVPPAGFFSFFKTGTCSARVRPPRPHHRALPPSASGPSRRRPPQLPLPMLCHILVTGCVRMCMLRYLRAVR